MASLCKIQISWTGISTGPGVSTFYLDNTGTPDLTPFKTFFEAIKTSIPAAVTIKYPSSGLRIDSFTGAATGTWAATAPADTVATGAGTYSAPVGAIINWRTGVYSAGRELRGKTFVVPLASVCFGGTGLLQGTTQTQLQNAAIALKNTAVTLVAFSKTHHDIAPVSTASVPLLAAVLRSRRD